MMNRIVRAVFAAVVVMVGVSAAFAAETVTVRPANHREPLVNPDMGLVAYHYSNRQWAYGQHLEPGDTLDWFPGVGCVYFRLPWCLLEPKEGEFRWDLIDTYARPWIAAGKQIAFRVTCCESRFTYATPEWVKDAGAKGWFFRDADPDDIWEPDYGDPVFLAKLENFLRAMARRYDGKPYVAHIDVGAPGEIPTMNDAIWAHEKTRGSATFAQDRRIPTLRTGTYTLAVSLGDAAGGGALPRLRPVRFGPHLVDDGRGACRSRRGSERY